MGEAARILTIEELKSQAEWRLDQVLSEIGLGGTQTDKLSNAEFLALSKARLAELGAQKAAVRGAMEDILMEPITLKLAGQEYQVHPHKIADERRWLKALGDIAGLVVESAGPLLADAVKGEEMNLENIDLGSVLGSAIPRVIAFGVPSAIDLMFAYSPELAADRKRIEENASLSERIDAAMEVVRLAFPQMLALLRKMTALMNAAEMRAS